MLSKIAESSSAWVWNEIKETLDISRSLKEESITDFFLKKLTIEAKPFLIIHDFTKKEEAVNGADWEWWFLVGGFGLAFRVQAKVVGFSSTKIDTYPQLHYKSGGQTQKLINRALAENMIPIYCLYTFWNHSALVPRLSCVSRGDLEHFGVSVVSAGKVKSIKSKKIIDISQFIHSLPCFFSAFNNFSDFSEYSFSHFLSQESTNARQGFIKDVENLPEYVSRILFSESNDLSQTPIEFPRYVKRVTIFQVNN
jgi:hypothetical protein